MRTSVMCVDETVVLVSKFDNADDRKANTIDELETIVGDIISAYAMADEEEEALLTLVQGLRAVTTTLDEGTVLSL